MQLEPSGGGGVEDDTGSSGDNGDDDGDDDDDDGNINAEQKEPATRTLGRGTLEDNPRGKLPPTWLGFCWDRTGQNFPGDAIAVGL